jgi:hypothetical protein
MHIDQSNWPLGKGGDPTLEQSSAGTQPIYSCFFLTIL